MGDWHIYLSIKNLDFPVANNKKKLIIMVFETQWKNERPWRLDWGNNGVLAWSFGGFDTHTQVYHFIEKMEDHGDWIGEIGIYIYSSKSEVLCGQYFF